MVQLLIQPSGGSAAQTHYEDTVRNLVRFDAHSELIDSRLMSELLGFFPEGQCAMWGLTPGRNDANRVKWERIEAGDLVAFTGKKRVFATGYIVSKFHNPRLARELWGDDENGDTWEYMYSIADVAESDIPYSLFNELLGDNPNNNHMGFRIVDDSKAASFGEFVKRHKPLPQPKASDVIDAIHNLDFEDIQKVVDEWNAQGREEFLRVNSLSGAFKFLLVWGDGRYDAKAVVVRALRLKHPEMAHLRASSFGGDYPSIAKPLRQAGWEVVDKHEVEKRDEDDHHEKVLLERRNIGQVEKLQLVKSRRGQGQFRHNVMLREKSCRVTGIADPEHLRASHIKPWSQSSDDEKLDGSNGLMLAPHIDHLFDRGWISFEDDGALIVSTQCDDQVLRAFGIDRNLNVGRFSFSQASYLAYHRTEVLR